MSNVHENVEKTDSGFFSRQDSHLSSECNAGCHMLTCSHQNRFKQNNQTFRIHRSNLCSDNSGFTHRNDDSDSSSDDPINNQSESHQNILENNDFLETQF